MRIFLFLLIFGLCPSLYSLEKGKDPNLRLNDSRLEIGHYGALNEMGRPSSCPAHNCDKENIFSYSKEPITLLKNTSGRD